MATPAEIMQTMNDSLLIVKPGMTLIIDGNRLPQKGLQAVQTYQLLRLIKGEPDMLIRNSNAHI
jgi:hypothetical protein